MSLSYIEVPVATHPEVWGGGRGGHGGRESGEGEANGGREREADPVMYC